LILISSSLQQLLSDSASMLSYTYIACLVKHSLTEVRGLKTRITSVCGDKWFIYIKKQRDATWQHVY